MIPLSDDNPTLRVPIVTYALLIALAAVWVFVQGAGFDPVVLATTVCNYGMVPGEVTHLAAVGTGVPLSESLYCVVDNEPINILTPLTSMFLHGGWAHLLGNCLFLWVFGNNVEDSMGRLRFVAFYILTGLIAAAAQVVISPSSPVPVVGASGAISGVLGAYLVLYPRVRVNMLFVFFIFFRVIPLPAWLVLVWWIFWQIIAGLPQLSSIHPNVSSGVAVFAHIGGFFAGMVLVKFFENERLVATRTSMRRGYR